eukprot:TRINITY_DN12098_c0_g1_i1.p1 TRINITY_DN12098_c0_g1~~TRINITY_DN12098_c0_g1_i1.p1  ORF type:complete len:988 (+),score=169.01 TRINITY_DN12098_c0_g1_i1:54-3017(+)
MSLWSPIVALLLFVGCDASVVNIAMVGDGDKSEWVNNMLSNATGIHLPVAMERTAIVQRYCFPYSCHTVCLYDNPQMDVCKCLQNSAMRGCMHILTNLEEIADGVPGGTVFGREFKNHEKHPAHAPDVIVLLANEINAEEDTTSSTSCAVYLRAKLPNSNIQVLSAEAAGSPQQLLFDATPKCHRTDSDIDQLEKDLISAIDAFAKRKATAEAKERSSRTRLHANIHWCITVASLCLLTCGLVSSVVRFSDREWEFSEETPFAGGGIRLAIAAARDVKVVTDNLGFTMQTTTTARTPSLIDENTDELDSTQQVGDCAACYINPVTFTDVVSEAKIIQSDLTSKIAALPRQSTKPGEPVPEGWMEPDLSQIYSRKEPVPSKDQQQPTKKKQRKKKQDWLDYYILNPLGTWIQKVYISVATKLLGAFESGADAVLSWIGIAHGMLLRGIDLVNYYCIKTPYRWYRILRGFEVTPLVQPAPPPPPPPPLDDDSESISTEGGAPPPPPPIPIPLIEIAPPTSLSRDFSHGGGWVLCCTPSSNCSHEHNASIQGHLPHWSCCGISNKESQCPLERKDVTLHAWSKTRRALLRAIRTAAAVKAVGASTRRDMKWRFRVYSRRILFRTKQLISFVRRALAKLIRGLIFFSIAVARISWTWLRFCGMQTRDFLIDLGFTFNAWDRFKNRCKALPGEVKAFIVETLLNPPNPFESYNLPVETTKRREENWTCTNSEADTDITGSFTPWEDEVSGHSRLIGRMHSQMEEHGGTAALLKEVEKTIQNKSFDDVTDTSSPCTLQLPSGWKRKKNTQPPTAPREPVVTKVISTQTPRRLIRVKEVKEKKKFTLPDQYRPAFDNSEKHKPQTKKSSGPVTKWVKHQLWPFGKDSDQESDDTDRHQLLNPDDDMPPMSPYASFNEGSNVIVDHDGLLGSSMFLPDSARQQMRRRKQRERFNTLVGGDVPLLPKNRVEGIIKHHVRGEDDDSLSDFAPDYLSP